MPELSREPALRRRSPKGRRGADAREGAAPARLADAHRFELRMSVLCNGARLLPALTAENAAAERARLIACMERGETPVPRFELRARRVPATAFRLLDGLRRDAEDLPGSALYTAKLDELELELLLLDSLGRPKLVRPLAARRYGTGSALAQTAGGAVPLARCARQILDGLPHAREACEVPASGSEDSLAALVHELADGVGLSVDVRVEPRLSAGAATGERTVFIAARRFGRNEARRLAVHEVYGHLLAAANGRAQPLRLLSWGTAGSFADQEGVALYMEERAGLLDAVRLRILAGRVLATDLMHGGASFAETARKLAVEEQFTIAEAIGIAERAYRGGGVARDAGYLLGFLRVHAAIASGAAKLEELQLGRVSLSAVPELRELMQQGYVRRGPYRPDFACRFFEAQPPVIDAAAAVRRELTLG